MGRFASLTTPERVDFARKCLSAASRELDAFFRAFNPEALAEARNLYQVYFAPAGS